MYADKMEKFRKEYHPKILASPKFINLNDQWQETNWTLQTKRIDGWTVIVSLPVGVVAPYDEELL